MNKHTKLAILVAPILAIIGYIASDYYMEYKAKQPKIFQLTLQESCLIANKQCVLSSGDFKVNIYSEGNNTILNSTYPLDSATLLLVDKNNQTIIYDMQRKENSYYWQAKVVLKPQQTLRLITTIKGAKYLAELQTN